MRLLMGRVAKAEQAARARARERRVQALFCGSASRNRRIEDAAVEVFLGLAARGHATALVSDAETRVGAALRRVLAEEIDVERAAALCELSVREVRRLSRTRRKTSSDAIHRSQGPALLPPDGRRPA